MYTLRYFSYLRERKYHFQVLREKEMKMNFIMNISKCFTKRRSNLVPWVFALGERNPCGTLYLVTLLNMIIVKTLKEIFITICLNVFS